MKILVVRHAIAQRREVFAKQNRHDDQRPLTAKGIQRMREGAVGLRRVVDRVDVLAFSPLVRARQTAEILARSLKPDRRIAVPGLAPGYDPTAATDWLQHLAPESHVCLVGHEPDLSALVAWLTCGRVAGFLELRRGSACLLHCPKTPARDTATLLWALAPRQLRLLGKH
jgi:phosphohistidine phosphatase